MLPEEQELDRLQADQALLTEKVTSAELALETIKTDAARFQRRYYQTVGRLYAELDKLTAEIAHLAMERAPGDETLRAKARASEKQAKQSAEEAGLINAQPRPPPVISSNLRRVYLQAVKLIHPDLTISENERQRRTALMALVNLAYERGDQRTIEKLIEEFGEDPEAIVGEDVGSRIVKAIRRIAQLRRRLSEIHEEIAILKKTDAFQLKESVEREEAIGNEPLSVLEAQLKKEISGHRTKLDTLRRTERSVAEKEIN